MGREGDSTPDNADTSIILSSLGFTRSGTYHYNDGDLGSQSSRGDFWSHTPSGKTNAYFLNFFSTGLYPRNNYARGDGFPLRCLAR